MVAIKILRAKEEEEENMNSVARGRSSNKSAVFLQNLQLPSLSNARRIYTPRGSHSSYLILA